MENATTHSTVNSQLSIPRLRFPEFSGEWEERLYGDVYRFLTTNSLSRDKLNYDFEGVRNIHYGDIHTKFKTLFDMNIETVPFINNNVDISRIGIDNYCQVGDLVIADASEDYSDIGKSIEIVNLNSEKTLAGLHTHLARPTGNYISIGFTGSLLKSWKVRKQVMTIAQGAKVLGISKTNLSKIKLNLPTKLEQQKIAAFLTAIDNKIEQLSKKQALLGKYKKGLMQQIFSQAIRFKADDGSDYPDWEEKRLGDLSVVILDGNYGELYPTSSDFKLTGVPFLRANNIKSLKIDGTDTKYITGEQHSLLTSGHLQTNDILITTRGVLGNLAIVDSTHNGSNINAQICLLRVTNTSELNHFYLLFVLDYRDSKKQYKALETGTALKQLPKGNLRKIKLKLPTLFEQTKIANFLSSIDSKIEQVGEQLNESKQFKKALLQQMFV